MPNPHSEPHSDPHSELIEKKRQRIVEGACKVFLKKGYHLTTTRDIAWECEMSIGHLYHYISSVEKVGDGVTCLSDTRNSGRRYSHGLGSWGRFH